MNIHEMSTSEIESGSPEPTGVARRRDLERTGWYRKEEYPFKSRFHRTASGAALHYLDEGRGDRVVVFVHGTPGWSFEFRHLIDQLCEDGYRVIVPDHLGFGFSDRPVASAFAYTPAAHAENLNSLLASLERQSASGLSYRFVLHDFGGMIGLRMLADICARRPGAVRALTIVNSWCLPFEESDPAFHKKLSFLQSGLLRWLYARLNFSAYAMVKAGWGSAGLDRRTHLHFRRLHRNRADRMGTLGFLRATYDPEANAFLRSAAESASQAAQQANLPVQLIWGAADSIVGPQHMRDWERIFSIAERNEIPDAGHFPQEEAPARVLHALRAFIGEIDAAGR